MMKNNSKYAIVLVGALSLIMLVALVLPGAQSNMISTNSPTQDNIKNGNIDEPLYGEGSASLIPFNHSDLLIKSDTIVIGKVKEILPSKWNTIDGKRPGGTVAFSPFCLIYTDIVISVDKYEKNPLSSKEVTVRVDGGKVGNDTLVSESEPSFQPGEKVLLYLTKDTSTGTKDIGPEHFRVTGLMQGKYALTDDGKAKRPDETISQDELLRTIKQ